MSALNCTRKAETSLCKILFKAQDKRKALASLLPDVVRKNVSPMAYRAGEWRQCSPDDAEKFDVSCVDKNEIMAAIQAVAAVCGESEYSVCLSQMTELRMRTIPRKMDEKDLIAQTKIYAESMIKYPPDVVSTVCKQWGDTEKFFPAWSELRQMLNSGVSERIKLLEGLKKAAS